MKKNIRLVVIVVVGCALVYGAWNLIGGRRNDSANRTLIGRTLVPWPERAEVHLRKHLFGGESGQNIANSIQGLTHPSGDAPKLSQFDIRRVGDQLSVVMDVVWKGGLTSAEYTTRVVWEFDKEHHIKASIREDNAPFSATESDVKKLDEYFRTECYAVLRSNLGD